MTRGQKIKELRKRSGYTQDELAKKVGVSFGLISKYEKDEVSIPSENLKTISKVLNTSMDYLEGLSDTNKEDMQYATYYNNKMKNMTKEQKDAIQKEVDNFADFVINKYFNKK